MTEEIIEITKAKDYKQNSVKQNKVFGLEEQIEHMIYKLYGLTQEEIEIVKGN